VTETTTLSTTDLQRLLAVVDPARCGGPGRFVPESFLSDLAALVGADDVTFQVMDPYRRTIALQSTDPGDNDDQDDDITTLWWRAFWESCCYPERSGDFSSVWRTGDRLPGVHTGPHWHAFAAATGVDRSSHMILPLQPQGSVDRRLILWRHSRDDFTDRDALLLALMRPHVEILQHVQAQGPRRLVPLTPRQLEVFRLMAVGRTNAEIAGLLVLSEATIRKHVENIYARLGVSTRTAAVLQASDLLT
jgi:DNA-binding CsgD family transcriptional regulator